MSAGTVTSNPHSGGRVKETAVIFFNVLTNLESLSMLRKLC